MEEVYRYLQLHEIKAKKKDVEIELLKEEIRKIKAQLLELKQIIRTLLKYKY